VLTVAILGFGFIGRAHGDAYARLPNVKLVAIGGCREERVQAWKAPYSFSFYKDPNALLDSCAADIIDICLPTFMHEEFVIRAAEKGMHVICEKPLALTVKEVDGMLAAVRKAGVIFMVAQILRFFTHYTKCRELVRDGRLGDVFFGSAARLAEPPRWAEWFQHPEKSGGALFDLQVHDLDYLMNLFGTPESLFAVGLQANSGCWDQVVTSLSYRTRKLIVEASSRLAVGWPFTSMLRLMGTAASLEYGFRVKGNVDVMAQAQHSLVLYPNGSPATHFELEDPDPYLRELKYFVDAVERRDKPDAVRPEEARNVIAVLEATKQSLETGTIVDLRHLFGPEPNFVAKGMKET
jgi:predicted dehydrogenase